MLSSYNQGGLFDVGITKGLVTAGPSSAYGNHKFTIVMRNVGASGDITVSFINYQNTDIAESYLLKVGSAGITLDGKNWDAISNGFNAISTIAGSKVLLLSVYSTEEKTDVIDSDLSNTQPTSFEEVREQPLTIVEDRV